LTYTRFVHYHLGSFHFDGFFVQGDGRAREHWVHFLLLKEIGEDGYAGSHHSLIHAPRRRLWIFILHNYPLCWDILWWRN